MSCFLCSYTVAMRRTFDEHEVRPAWSLDGRWQFVTQGDKPPMRKDGLPRSYARSIQVPSCWELLPGLESYRGVAWFRTVLERLPGRPTRLVFGGVSHTADVYVDGRRLGHHYDAFTPFEVVVPAEGDPADDRPIESELVLRVDNTFGPHSGLHLENDYYTWGGITRPAEAQALPDDGLFIQRIFATPTLAPGGRWNLDLRVRLGNLGTGVVRRTVRVAVAGCSMTLGPIAVPPAGDKTVEGRITGIAADPWSASSPSLYFLTAQLIDPDTDEITDDLIDRVGFRQVRVRGKRVLLNGRAVRFRGFNRHESHGNFGCALPLEAQAQDLEILRDLGCNFVRTAHYPNDQRFLDLCDEMGFYVWEESHARQVKSDHPAYPEQITRSTQEMLDWHHNHPAIVMWGYLNECESRTPEGRDEHARLYRLIKQCDPSRPVTFACHYNKLSIAYRFCDIVSWNRYDAWYSGWTQKIEPAIKDMIKWLDTPASKGGAGKPVIMSEFGGAGLYGCRARTRAKWTEEYQSDILDESLRVYLHHPRIVGAAIWQFTDCRVTENHWSTRARTHNNKGTLDEFRRPKLAYDTVKARMEEAAKKWNR